MSNITRPDLAVIDSAIELLREGKEWGCGHALNAASATPRGLDSEYARQFSEWARLVFGWPSWSDNPSSAFTGERIAYLQAFRKACIDAAAKEQS